MPVTSLRAVADRAPASARCMGHARRHVHELETWKGVVPVGENEFLRRSPIQGSPGNEILRQGRVPGPSGGDLFRGDPPWETSEDGLFPRTTLPVDWRRRRFPSDSPVPPVARLMAPVQFLSATAGKDVGLRRTARRHRWHGRCLPSKCSVPPRRRRSLPENPKLRTLFS